MHFQLFIVYFSLCFTILPVFLCQISTNSARNVPVPSRHCWGETPRIFRKLRLKVDIVVNPQCSAMSLTEAFVFLSSLHACPDPNPVDIFHRRHPHGFLKNTAQMCFTDMTYLCQLLNSKNLFIIFLQYNPAQAESERYWHHLQ